jgi:hypothetical protein
MYIPLYSLIFLFDEGNGSLQTMFSGEILFGDIGDNDAAMLYQNSSFNDIFCLGTFGCESENKPYLFF